MNDPKHILHIFADYFQVLFEDETASIDLSDAWTQAALENMLAFDPASRHGFGIATARNMTVPVHIEIRDSAPTNTDFTAWDQVNECSIELPAGVLVVTGGSDYRPDAPRLSMSPDTYRVRIHYANLADISEDGLDGKDEYLLQFWPAPFTEAVILKQRGSTTIQA